MWNKTFLLNYLLFLGALFIYYSCGVKGKPLPPKSSTVPSLFDNYPDMEIEEKMKTKLNKIR